MIRLVLDTNVLVSAFLRPFSVPAQVVRLALAGDVLLCVDERILNEYYEVLQRPRFALSLSEVNDMVAFIHDRGEFVTSSPQPLRVSDQDDQMFVDVAIAAKADYLVTGNLKHFGGLQKYGVRVVSPKQFLDGLHS